MIIDKKKYMQVALHVNEIKIEDAIDITKDIMGNIIRGLKGTASNRNFEIEIPNIIIRMIDKNNAALFNETAYDSYYEYFNTSQSHFIEIFIYGVSEFIGLVDKKMIKQDGKNGFNFVEFTVPNLMYTLDSKIINYVGTSIGDLEGLTRFCLEIPSTQSVVSGELYSLTSSECKISFSQDVFDKSIVPTSGLILIDTEIASYSSFLFVEQLPNEKVLYSFTITERELFGTAKSSAELDSIKPIIVKQLNFDSQIKGVIYDVEDGKTISNSSVSFGEIFDDEFYAKTVTDIAVTKYNRNNLLVSGAYAVGVGQKFSTYPDRIAVHKLKDSRTSEIVKNTSTITIEKGTKYDERPAITIIHGVDIDNVDDIDLQIAAQSAPEYDSVVSIASVYFDLGGSITNREISLSQLGITKTELDNSIIDYICNSDSGRFTGTPASNPSNTDIVFSILGNDGIYDFSVLSRKNDKLGWLVATIESDDLDSVYMRLYGDMPSNSGFSSIKDWLDSGVFLSQVYIGKCRHTTEDFFIHGFIRGSNYLYLQDGIETLRIAYHTDSIGNIKFQTIDLKDMAFTQISKQQEFLIDSDYSPYIRKSKSTVTGKTLQAIRRRSAGVRSQVTCEVGKIDGVSILENSIKKTRYLYDCIEYDVKDKKLLDVISDFRKYYFAIVFLDRNQNLVFKNLKALFISGNYTVKETIQKKDIIEYKTETWDFSTAKPPVSSKSAAIQIFYENEALRLFQFGVKSVTVKTKKRFDLTYFDYFYALDRDLFCLGVDVDIDSNGVIEYTYTGIAKDITDLLDPHSVL